jgi:hypothetical protein
MECFGSDFFRRLLIITDRALNGPKGNVMALRRPIAVNNIKDLANAAVATDTQDASDALLSALRIVNTFGNETNFGLIRAVFSIGIFSI